MRRFLLTLGFFLTLSAPAWAINCATANGACFWIGGTGTLDLATDSAHWSNSTGGGTCSCEPISTNSLTFDSASGGGTVTVAVGGGTLSVASITFGTFTGTLDFAANDNNVTLSAVAGVSGTGTGVRNFKMGDGTWTFTAAGLWSFSTVTNLTFSADASTIAFTNTLSTTEQFLGGGLTYNIVTVAAPASAIRRFVLTGGNTFTTLTFTGAGHKVVIPASATQTITNLSLSGGSSTQPNALFSNTTGTAGTISVASGSVVFAYALYISDVTCTGGATFTATSSYDFGNNTGISSFTAPVSGSGGGIIGG